ncbi:MAG: proline--tRNA ligase [Elusimicrobia bacterium RIFCSPLOWO2_02_FULL_39_32]|nr:MAG: proline--tRNA ligase [Elusimicrobia bacterium RIFCSPHIGHO2_02_FULL_39_36]OGR93114.1 MAG: proline--tRNA ligase [Elusimicrobia bacterium RIFCSPLOWO2_02_FULL_39_32]OGR99338.1 MAG: proline--tRNA ligase [Elusimicrobia bacterium RIFCSPLOWO2_12_FULL_39_28]
MKISKILIPTLREAPKDAENISAKLMIRAGMIRKLASGIYDWLPLGLKVLKNVEKIVREEMDAIGGQEVWLPVIQPKELWSETGRWQIYGKELLRIKDRKGSEFCFAPTAEEVITDLARKDVRSYRQLPIMFYQFGAKFRDEIRPRFGVMRAREFYMKDAYSFHADEADVENYYSKILDAYSRIFKRCGLQFRAVEAETGAIGGTFSHEFMVLADTGEEEIVSCSPNCNYAANVERAECIKENSKKDKETLLPLEEISTPNAWTVEDVAKCLNANKEKFIKTMFYKVDDLPVIALIRGDQELNEFKLLHALNGQKIELMSEKEYSLLADCEVGFAGPYGLKERAKKSGVAPQIVADYAVSNLVNGISGANKKDFHLKNININRDYQPEKIADLRKIKNGDSCIRCAQKGIESQLRFSRGIEVGHAFKLGAKYSKAMNAVYLDEKGTSHPFIMGCYGIGISRVVASAIEQNYDEQGIIWTKNLAPFKVSIVPVNFEHPETRKLSEEIESQLESKGIETLLDDRLERAGVKFKDSDLIGIPVRITVSERGIEKGTVEIKLRSQPELKHCPKETLLDEIQRILAGD